MTINHPDWRNEDWDFEPSDQFLQGQPTDQVEYIYDEGGLEQDEPTAEFEAEDDSMFGKLRSQIVEGIAGALERKSSSALFKKVEDAWVDGQRAMADLVARLSPLEEYAAAYMSTAGGLWQGGKVTFDKMLVGSKGVTHESGGFTLHDYGMWRIDAQLWPDLWATNAGNSVDYEIRVLSPSGDVWHRKSFRQSSSVAFSAPLSTSVVVPEAGFRVEVHVTNIIVGRSLLGGSNRTHLFVHHINREKPKAGDTTGQN